MQVRANPLKRKAGMSVEFAGIGTNTDRDHCPTV